MLVVVFILAGRHLTLSLTLDPSALLCWDHQELLVQRGEAGPDPSNRVTLSGKLAGRVGESWPLGYSAIWGLLQLHTTFPHTILSSTPFHGVRVDEFFFRGRVCSWALPFARVASHLSAHASSRLHIGCWLLCLGSSPPLFQVLGSCELQAEL